MVPSWRKRRGCFMTLLPHFFFYFFDHSLVFNTSLSFLQNSANARGCSVPLNSFDTEFDGHSISPLGCSLGGPRLTDQ
jgi:hypothetical protein